MLGRRRKAGPHEQATAEKNDCWSAAAGLLHCAVARSQEAQPAKPAPPTHLLTGKQAVLPVTVTNQCPQQESFSVTTDGQLGKLLRTVQPISSPSSGGQSVLLVDTRSVAPGLYSGNIVVTCVSCGASASRTARSFQCNPLIGRVGGHARWRSQHSEAGGRREQAGGRSTSAEWLGKGQPGTTAPQENPARRQAARWRTAREAHDSGNQPGQTPTDGNPPGGPEKPPSGGASRAARHRAGTGGSAPTPGGTTPGGATPGGPGGDGATAPLAGGNAPPTPPAPGMGPDEGLPLPKIPPLGRTRRIAAAPCPCEKVCADAVAAEQRPRTLAEYMNEAVVKRFQTLITTFMPISRMSRRTRSITKARDNPVWRPRSRRRWRDEKSKENDYKELRAAQASAHAAGEPYQDAAVRAANARLLCDACSEQHPECPQSIRAPGVHRIWPAANPRRSIRLGQIHQDHGLGRWRRDYSAPDSGEAQAADESRRQPQYPQAARPSYFRRRKWLRP